MLADISDHLLLAQMRGTALMQYFQTLSALSDEVERFLMAGAFARDLSVQSGTRRGWVLV
jgi:hypothetical protein